MVRKWGFVILALMALSLIAADDTHSQPKPVTDAIEQVSDPQDKMICKRFVETGSLVKGYRVCKTKREWVIARQEIRDAPPTAASCANLNPNTPC